MTNIVPFPTLRWIDNDCHYAGQRYEHPGEIRKAVPTGEWRRLVEQDTLQRLRTQLRGGGCESGGGSAA
jgi:hypothetical protein